MKKKTLETENFYLSLSKDKKNLDRLKNKLSTNCRLDRKFVEIYLIPIAQKMGFHLSVEDILKYEKEKANNQEKLTENQLLDVSGGKILNKIANFGILTLMGLSGGFQGINVSAEFIPFNQTQEATNIQSGNIPFYLQADQLIDGILWFKDPNSQKVFFILERKMDSSERLVRYTCPYRAQIKKFENKLLEMDKLPKELRVSCMRALLDRPTQKVRLSIIEDNPLYNFARFYSPNFKFDTSSQREKLEDIPMYSSNDNSGLFSSIPWTATDMKANELVKALKEKISWKIAHRIKSTTQPNFKIIESSSVLNRYYKLESKHTGSDDVELLRNDGFTFFTLQPLADTKTLPSMFGSGDGLYEAVLPFDDIPLVSCSKDMLPRINPGSGNMFYQESDELVPAFPCFNGSSEDVKEQLVKFYVKDELTHNPNCKTQSTETVVDDIIEKIHQDELEVRIPTNVVLEKPWCPYR